MSDSSSCAKTLFIGGAYNSTLICNIPDVLTKIFDQQFKEMTSPYPFTDGLSSKKFAASAVEHAQFAPAGTPNSGIGGPSGGRFA